MLSIEDQLRLLTKFFGYNLTGYNIDAESKLEMSASSKVKQELVTFNFEFYEVVFSFFQLPEIKADQIPKVVGLLCYLKALMKKSNSQLYGNSAEEEAYVNQILELKLSILDKCSSDKDLLPYVQDLNTYLANKVYVAGNQFTIADILLYYTLHDYCKTLSFQEKQSVMNVSRWFHLHHLLERDWDLEIIKKSVTIKVADKEVYRNWDEVVTDVKV
ncbi:Eukaryotic translation elongation factor 1 epsilon-1 [Nymphon striatum]|nr:Eukaryotic translation elongation factor 1 epsilon-1 [Nymphon striatum]KAG1654953.1 Eukaryotic translation elongation factor 1 epsilon-1 [Nymphon striatum]KAG1654954.1 Eukaryotic translation elongation factor 1 epsilon-1 [Nymphon striatum]